MGKENYTGYKEFEKFGQLTYMMEKSNLGIRDTVCQRAKNVGLYLFGTNLANRQTPTRFTINPLWLKSMFATAKMIGYAEKVEAQNKEKLEKIKDKLTAEDYQALLNGKSLNDLGTFEEFKKRNSQLDSDAMEDLDLVSKNNSYVSAFKADLKETDNTYALGTNGVSTKQLMKESFEAIGFKEEEIKDLFNPYFMDFKSTPKELTKDAKEEYDSSFTAFMNRVDELKKEKYEEMARQAEQEKTEELRTKMENSYQGLKNANEKDGKDGVDIVDALTSAVNVHMQMQRRLQSPLYKRIPIIRWLSSDFRKENSALKDSEEKIASLQGKNNITALLKENHSFAEIYGLIDKLSIESYKDKYNDLYIPGERKDKKPAIFLDKDMEKFVPQKDMESIPLKNRPTLDENKTMKPKSKEF